MFDENTKPLTKQEREALIHRSHRIIEGGWRVYTQGAVHDAELALRYEAMVSDLESKLSSLLAERAEDTERLDWLDGSAWISCSKTDESDNNGVGMVDSAVVLLSRNPDGKSDFPMQRAATFRKVIDSARSSGGNTK